MVFDSLGSYFFDAFVTLTKSLKDRRFVSYYEQFLCKLILIMFFQRNRHHKQYFIPISQSMKDIASAGLQQCFFCGGEYPKL